MNKLRNTLAMMAATLAAAAAGDKELLYADGLVRKTSEDYKVDLDLTPAQLEATEAAYEAQFKIFMVHGKKIKARSMTDAKRIYNHLNKKRK